MFGGSTRSAPTNTHSDDYGRALAISLLRLKKLERLRLFGLFDINDLKVDELAAHQTLQKIHVSCIFAEIQTFWQVVSMPQLESLRVEWIIGRDDDLSKVSPDIIVLNNKLSFYSLDVQHAFREFLILLAGFINLCSTSCL